MPTHDFINFGACVASPRPRNQAEKRLALGHGSAWHLLRCLGWHREVFSAQIAREVGASSISWLDFPATGRNQTYLSGLPIRDGEWKGMAFLADQKTESAYSKFWPSRGEQQNWDAIGKAMIDGQEEWLLIEAKAHDAEIRSIGTKASESGGRPKIRAAFISTLEALGYTSEAASTWAEKWLTGDYQNANRLATLHFFTQQGIAARLIYIYFCGDQHPGGKLCPATPAEWQPTLDRIRCGLGLQRSSILESRVHCVFVNVNLAVHPRSSAV